MKRILVSLIEFYRKTISPIKKPSCRFYPSCSAYAVEAIEEYGAFKGLALSIKRVLKCHPFHPGGYDPLKRSQKHGNI